MGKVTDMMVCEKMIAKKVNATSRGIKFDISFKRMKQLMKQKTCFYTGQELILGQISATSGPAPNTMSIDRVENHIGYIDSNVVACCHWVNVMKRNMTIEQVTQLYKGMQKVIARNDKKNPKRLKPIPLPKPKTTVDASSGSNNMGA